VRRQVDPRKRARAKPFGATRDDGEAPRLAVGFEELRGVARDAAELDRLLKNDRPTDDRQEEQDEEDELRDQPRISDQLAKSAKVSDR
jgi:hypothetical protein